MTQSKNEEGANCFSIEFEFLESWLIRNCMCNISIPFGIFWINSIICISEDFKMIFKVKIISITITKNYL